MLTSGLKPMVDSNQAETERVHNEQHSGVSRRRLLRTIAAGVGSTATALYINSDDVEAAASDEVPIVIGFESKDPDRPHESFGPVKKNVPADWYNDLQHARQVKAQINENFGKRPDVIGIGVVTGKYGGHSAYIEIDVLPEHVDTARGELPEQVDNVPIEVTASGVPTPDSCNTYDFGSTVPGGVQCEAGIGDEPIGTLMSRLYDSSGNHRFCTAQHLFKVSGTNRTNYDGEDLHHPTDAYARIGEVVSSHCYDDIVVAAPRNSHSPERRIEDASPSAVNGQFTKDGLADLDAAGENLHKIGRTTCHTSGSIKAIDWTIWSGYGCLPRDHQVKWGSGSDSEGGDSGAAVYHENPNNSSYIWIASVDQYSNDGSGDYVGGTSAYSIKNQHGYHW